MIHKGSCHCGAVAFEFEGDIDAAITCNCSICSRKAPVLTAITRDRFRLLTAEDAAATYTFNKHAIRHRFCRTCGIHPYGESGDADDASIYVNLRCLQDFDLASVPIHAFDGRSA
ncbi:hypothetical protein IP90_02608 [Luteimonas cucumeris]|uniref:CENP-V/GFA domain-containing protein n=1 Tax=Luteimonas cucumeris TaxID=985012 RepID=A0A562L0D0_9GAMM|nr:GFA family protein [Luteimonas cucumeris]TWI00986.1 hypothetical protein IP90_02608 [Luteimonas cucumeris]